MLTGESDPPQLVLEKLDGVVGRGSHAVKLVEWDRVRPRRVLCKVFVVDEMDMFTLIIMLRTMSMLMLFLS